MLQLFLDYYLQRVHPHSHEATTLDRLRWIKVFELVSNSGPRTTGTRIGPMSCRAKHRLLVSTLTTSRHALNSPRPNGEDSWGHTCLTKTRFPSVEKGNL